jgi:hypothetical protein
MTFKYPNTSKNLAEMLPFFFNDLSDVIPNVNVANRVVAALVKAIRLGEDKFQQEFGGWMPQSNQFGAVPLRPPHLGFPDNRWIWTDGATSSVYWSAEDSFVSISSLDSKAIVLLYGYFNLEPVPNTLELFIQPGSTKFPIWSVVPLRLSKQRYFVLPSPIIIEPLSGLVIKASTQTTAATSEEAGFLGYYLAPLSRLIDENLMES